MRVTGMQHQNPIQSFSNSKYVKDKIDIASREEESVIVEISSEGKRAISLKDKSEFLDEITALDRKANYLPEYSGIYDADKAIATAVESCSKEEQAFVYDIIRQNLLIKNASGITEEERQANISLGMKKAEYAAQNFIPEDNREAFLEAVETVAKLASAGKTEIDGTMDYGVKKGNYLGHGSNLVYTTDALDVMKRMDEEAYSEYQKISKDSSNEDRALNTLKYLTNWYSSAVSKNPHMLDKYEEKTNEYMKEIVENQKLDTTFENINTESKDAFINSLRQFQHQNPNFMFGIIDKELSLLFWKN